MFLGGRAREFHESLAMFAKENDGFRYYYVTAYEMAQFIKQAQLGFTEPDFGAFQLSAALDGARDTAH